MCNRASGDQGIRHLHSMATSILAQVDARLTTDFFVYKSAGQRLEKIIQCLMLIRPSAGPEFRYADRRIQNGGAGIAELNPFGNDVCILAARDFDQDVRIDENRHFL
jgi:hypothetical protein